MFANSFQDFRYLLVTVNFIYLLFQMKLFGC